MIIFIYNYTIMKYRKELQSILRNFPYYIRKLCISYKKWKKAKFDPLWQTKLYIDCARAEYAPKELWDINMKTFYKICKRYEKKYNVPAKEFYNRTVKSSRFKFTAQARETLI